MKAILLAAGRGTRISKYIKEIPKSTLPIKDGTPLIRHTAEIMLSKGIEVVVCTGFKYDHIHKALEGLPIKYYYNPFFAVTNSIASLWFAKDEVDDDLIVMNADVFFSNEILDNLIDNKDEVILVSDKSRISEGDYFFQLNDQDKVIRYGKDILLEERSCEYVGMAKVSKSFAPNFKDRLCALIDNGDYNFWWENILYSFTDEDTNLISTMDVENRFWAEIDFLDDYNKILRYVKSSETK